MRRRSRTILFLLLLAAVVNVATAWWCAATIDVFRSPQLIAQQRTGTGAELWVARWERGGAMAIHRARSEHFVPTGGPAEAMIPSWTGLSELGPSHRRSQVAHDRQWVLGYGWPLLSMRTTIEVPYAAMFHQPRVTRGIDLRLTDYDVQGSDLPHVLPVEPIWRGFVANTLLWAALLGLPPAVLRAARGRFRLSRAVCPRCTYPIGASPMCTECGEPLRGAIRRRGRWSAAVAAALPHARRVIIAMLIGVAVNIAVAWSCAVGVDVYEAAPTEAGGANGAVSVWRRPGAATVRVLVTPWNLLRGAQRVQRPEAIVPGWAGNAAALRPRGDDRWLDARGWPLPSMWSEPHLRYSTTITGYRTSGGIATSLPTWPAPAASANPAVVPRVLPLRVWWPGFLVDSALYGVIAWLLLAGAWRLGRKTAAARTLTPSGRS